MLLAVIALGLFAAGVVLAAAGTSPAHIVLGLALMVIAVATVWRGLK